tara:strand:- start:41 stop:397 length:357 start_codon:yes stop_codon:yes gene_type:complete
MSPKKTKLGQPAAKNSDLAAGAKSEIRNDRILKLMMRLGLPLALISVISLWASSYLESAGIGLLFIICAPLALLIGFGYNIRYVMLLVRQRRQKQLAAAKALQDTPQQTSPEPPQKRP